MKTDNDNGDARELESFARDLQLAVSEIPSAVSRVLGISDQTDTRACQAEWHVRGIRYHCENLFKHYQRFARGVSARATSSDSYPLALVMHSPEVQSMMFEFYALVNLARISLDRLIYLLGPVFKTPLSQLPNSVNDLLRGKTECPVYQTLAKQHVVRYLIDVRDCLVHFRSFATSDNAVVIQEGQDEPTGLSDPSFFRASFRPVDERRIAVNVLLPDRIFTDADKKKMEPFLYEQRISLLSQSREFLQLIAKTTTDALALLIQPGKPVYEYSKNKKQN
jgi:hypothetical protein